jgi:uncharacterized membrane protein
MERTPNAQTIHRAFQIGVVLKAIDGVLELAGGVLLFFTTSLTGLLGRIAQRELDEGRHAALANAIQHYLPYIAQHSHVFAAVYLLSHGAVKVVLAVGLLKDQLWAYPAALVVFSLFIIYQVYRYTRTHSAALVVLTVFDIVVVWLTWREWRLAKAAPRPA